MLICICGDSFFSVDYHFPNTHWSEILSLSKNIEILNLSITGASNINIRFQVKYAVNELKADGIILTTTNHNRLDLRKDHLLHHYNQPANINIKNFNITDNSFYRFLWNPNSEKIIKRKSYKWLFRSMTLGTVLNENKLYASKEFQDNFEIFFTLLKDDDIEFEKDCCVIQNTINEFEEKILLFDPRYFDILKISAKKIIKLSNRFEFNPNTMYHTSVEEQKILAAEVKEKLKNLYNIH